MTGQEFSQYKYSKSAQRLPGVHSGGVRNQIANNTNEGYDN
jgi:hypothetical protein